MQVRNQELDDAAVTQLLEGLWAFLEREMEYPHSVQRLLSSRSLMGSEWHAVVVQARQLFHLPDPEA